MHPLHPAGAYTPNSLDLSRAAARRHAHLDAVRANPTPKPHRRWRWLGGLVARQRPATARSVLPGALQRPHPHRTMSDGAGAA
jgi:hypothetical protein